MPKKQPARVDTVEKKITKGLTPAMIKQIQEITAAEAEKSIDKFKYDRIETRQEELIDQIKNETLAASDYIKVGIDTNGLDDEQEKIMRWFNIAKDGVFINKGAAQTTRNLEVSNKILKELLSRTYGRKTSIDNYYKGLRDFRNTIDSLNSDTTLYHFSSDSATAMQYLQKIIILSSEIRPADSVFKQALLNAASLETKINTTVAQLKGGINQTELYQEELWRQNLKREFPNITGKAVSERPLSQIISLSMAKGRLVLYFYLLNNVRKLFLLIVLMFAAWYFLRSLKQQLNDKAQLKDDYSEQLVLRYPLISAILIVLTIFQFIFIEPAFIFNTLIWAISGICLTIIFRGYISKYWLYAWLILYGLFLLACLDNFILQASLAERWFMLLLAAAGIATSLGILLRNNKRKELKEKWIIYFIAMVGLAELMSAIANIYGRYNFSKSLLTAGFVNVVIGILLLWIIRLINQGLSLASLVYETPDKKLFYINFRKLGNKVPRLFYVLLVVGWIVLLGRNFYSFRAISAPFRSFLFDDRNIGNYTFTIYNLFIFFAIIIVSTMVSRVVSFFASDDTATTSGSKAGLGSWLLLVRIAIISIGTLLAFAAAGIPMDRITIIISALGVGIGFGLQTLVNNLVSGLIISFEKPINVGDIVEVGTNSGVMKSIGFRSSILYTWDGADVIIPNGDLLNQHLVNWTLSNTNRRISIMVGVAYGTDLDTAKAILIGLVEEDIRILKSPPPAVLIENFNDSSIDIKLLFWVHDIRMWLKIKSDIILAIDIAFKQNNITIPFPQQDIYIHPLNTDDTNDNIKPEDKTGEDKDVKQE